MQYRQFMNIEENLEYVGLKSKESKAYVALLKLRSANPHAVAKEADIERTTIYSILESLVEKGLANKSIRGKRIEYSAESPEALKNLLFSKTETLQQLLPLLASLQGTKGNKPVIKFYDHQDGIRHVVSASLNCQEKVVRDLSFVGSLVEVLGIRFVHQHVEKRVQNKIKLKSLRRAPGVNNQLEKDWFLKKENDSLLREIRHLPKNIEFEPLVMIYDHVVAIISSRKESFALVIESPEFSQVMKTLFDIAWGVSKN